ncbi:MAG: hypothetical protein ABR524_04505 [Thermoanaerobaculia bacterium]
MQSSADPESRIASGRKSARWRRGFRKHRLALVLWGVVVALLVIPTVFSGRVLSPNDVYYGHDPWRSLREIEARNPLMSDPPSSWMPLWSLLRSSPDSFHWNPWVGGGIPGWGSAAAAVLSPVVLLPVLLVPLLFSYLAIVLTKLTVGFVLAYGWLREERLGRNGAALGALLFSACGVYSVWWLWQATNATVFYPAVFWILRRAWAGRTTPVLPQIGLALALALSGFPATTLYVGWAGLAYAAWLAASRRKLPVRELAKSALAVALAALLAAPFLAPFASFIQRTGYLEGRETVAAAAAGRYPAEHLLAFFDPYRLGDAGRGLWNGDAALGISNNFNESTIYLGFIALPLAAIGVFARRRDRWFWIAFFSGLLLLLFAPWDSLANAIGSLPGVRYSPLARLRFLLPLPAAWLAAAGAGMFFRRRARLQLLAVGVLGAWLVLDLGAFAVRYLPFPSFEVARLPQSPAISRLQQEKAPFRVAPMFDFLWPNTSQLVRLEDVRSHFGSEERWRRLLNRFAPGSFGSTGTVVLFNSLNFDFDDPLVSFLNIRWFAEQPSIDILRWRIAERSSLSEPLVGSYRMMPGQELRQTVEIDGTLRAIDLNFDAPSARERGAAIELALIRPETGKSVWTRRIAVADLERLPKVYVPIRPWGEEGNALILSIRARGMFASVPRGASGIAHGRVRSPIILHSVDRDGRLFENLAAQNRYFAVWDVESMSFEEFLAAPELDLSRVAALTGSGPTEMAGAIESVPPLLRRVSMRTRWAPDRAVIETDSRAPFLLATSEKITPELEIRVDGERREPIEINGLFAAVPMEAGAHTVVLERRIGRGLWLPAAGAAVGVVVLALVGWIGRGPRRRTLSPAARPRR